MLAKVQMGEVWCCGREFQNSIDDSCHAMLQQEIERLEMTGFDVQSKNIIHESGGRTFYKGLNRNPASIKSIVANGIWIEEGETLSAKTIKVMSASFRITAAQQAKAAKEGVEAKVPDIIITMNRGNSKDPMSDSYLRAAESDIAKKGWYADENILVVQCNYTDIPRKWWLASGLEAERARDERLLPKAEYDHIWHGAYNDTVENAIIKPEWVDACVDAHVKLAHVGNWTAGQEKVAFDPSDVGKDPEALCHLKGNVIVEAISADVKDVEKATNWACSYANENKVDVFTWDCDGLGAGLKHQVSTAFNGRKIEVKQFKGSEGVLNPEYKYKGESGDRDAVLNKDAFANQRAQWYADLRDKIFNTYLAVTEGRYFSVDDMISFSSEITHLKTLRSELCSIPRKYVASGKFTLMTKHEMLAKHIASPNIADCVMMTRKPTIPERKPKKLGKARGWGGR